MSETVGPMTEEIASLKALAVPDIDGLSEASFEVAAVELHKFICRVVDALTLLDERVLKERDLLVEERQALAAAQCSAAKALIEQECCSVAQGNLRSAMQQHLFVREIAKDSTELALGNKDALEAAASFNCELDGAWHQLAGLRRQLAPDADMGTTVEVTDMLQPSLPSSLLAVANEAATAGGSCKSSAWGLENRDEAQPNDSSTRSVPPKLSPSPTPRIDPGIGGLANGPNASSLSSAALCFNQRILPAGHISIDVIRQTCQSWPSPSHAARPAPQIAPPPNAPVIPGSVGEALGESITTVGSAEAASTSMSVSTDLSQVIPSAVPSPPPSPPSPQRPAPPPPLPPQTPPPPPSEPPCLTPSKGSSRQLANSQRTHTTQSTQSFRSVDEFLANSEEFAFQSTIWDASMLLFFRFKDGTKIGTTGERFIMIASVLLNFVIQILFVLVLWFNMIGNPYDDATVRDMLKWRALQHDVEHGLEEMVQTNKTRINTFCKDRSYWSFEQAEYGVLNDYFHKGLPGQCLSCAGLLIWVLTVFKEYRVVVAQFLALLKLPTLRGPEASINVFGVDVDQDGVVEDSELRIEIEGVHEDQRILMILFLPFLRLVVLCALCFVGCVFVATEPALSNIILNCAALGFILEVDELIYTVIFTDRIKQFVKMAQPIKIHSMGKCGGFPVHDIFRYLLLIAVCAIAIVFGLLPFLEHMNAADQALCGGDWNFLFSQNYWYNGSTDPTIVIIRGESDPPVLSCNYEGRDAYRNNAYPTDKRRVLRNETKEKIIDNRIEAVLDYAFGSANTRIPTKLRPFPKTTEVIQTLYTPSGVALAECPRFNGTRESCDAINDENSIACLWSYEAVFCERITETLNFREARPISEHACTKPDELTKAINSYSASCVECTDLRSETDLWWYYLSPTGRDPMQSACYYPEGGCNCSDGYLSILCHPRWGENPLEFLVALDDDEPIAEPRRLEIGNGPL